MTDNSFEYIPTIQTKGYILTRDIFSNFTNDCFPIHVFPHLLNIKCLNVWYVLYSLFDFIQALPVNLKIFVCSYFKQRWHLFDKRQFDLENGIIIIECSFIYNNAVFNVLSCHLATRWIILLNKIYYSFEVPIIFLHAI
jgi:hypothetical protein